MGEHQGLRDERAVAEQGLAGEAEDRLVLRWEFGRVRARGFRFPVSGFRFPVSGFRFPVSGFTNLLYPAPWEN
ncbi:hypothetical protein AB0M72_07925, partial [Nocardiopsis dassonvillei]